MKKSARYSFAVLVSAVAMMATVSAPAVFAEDGHGGRGRGSDDVARTVAVASPAMVADDDDINGVDIDDINDDNGGAAPAMAAPQAPVDVRHDDVADND